MPAAAQPDDSQLGSVLADKYRLLRELGRGGMGIVYEAEHVHLGKRVAVKLMLDKYLDNTEAIRRFQREAQAASRIGNPHIIDIGDVGVAHDGRPFVVMEILNGLPLSKVLEQTGPMAPWRAIEIMRQVLRAVGAAHAAGIIHRDLKPDNIFLVQQGDQHDFVKLLDFGISKVIDPDEQVAFTKLTSTGVVMGTPLYMAPEQAMGSPITSAADIYACGVILYEMLAGRPPFEGPTYAVLVAKLLTQDPQYLGNARPGLPLALVKAVHRALEKEPQARFASAEEFAASLPGDRTPSEIELAGTLDSGLAVARVTVGRPAQRRMWIPIAAALLLGGVTAAVLIATQTGAEAPRPAAAEPAKPEPTVAPGTLEVKTSPAGAQVFVDNEDKGIAPLTVTLVPGTHRVRAVIAGYRGLETDVEVSGGAKTSVMLPLVAVPALADDTAKATPPYIVQQKTPNRPAIGQSGRTGSGAVKPSQEPAAGGAAPMPRDEPPPVKVKTGPVPADSKPNPYDKPNPY